MNKLKQFNWNILIAIDQLANVLFGGDPDETISSRLGRMKRDHGGTIPWFHPVARLLDESLEVIDPGHTLDSIEEDEGKDAVVKHATHLVCQVCSTLHRMWDPADVRQGERYLVFCTKCRKETYHDAVCEVNSYAADTTE